MKISNLFVLYAKNKQFLEFVYYGIQIPEIVAYSSLIISSMERVIMY